MIIRAGDSIWVTAMPKRRGPSGRGSDPNPPLPYQQEQMRRRHEWELRRQQNEDLDKQWSATPLEPTDPVDIGQLLDQEYARHQRRNRGWTGNIFDPDPVDTSLPREAWDGRVREFLRNPVRSPGAEVARDPHALAGEDAVKGVRSSLINTLGIENVTNKGVADRIKNYYQMGRPGT